MDFILISIIIIIIIAFRTLIKKCEAQYYFQTIAGTGVGSSTGDNGLASLATINCPEDMWGDTSGNLYIAEFNGYRVRKISSSGIITTLIGTGSEGTSGAGGVGTSVSLDGGYGIYGDSSNNNLYVSGYLSFLWQYSFSSGIVTRIAGALPASQSFGGDGGPAISAKFNYLEGVFLSSIGVLYISDNQNHLIRYIATSGIVNTFAGDGTGGYGVDNVPAITTSLFYPIGIWGNSLGVIYIADAGNSRIRAVNTPGIISTVAGTGSTTYNGDGIAATTANLYWPSCVKGDTQGNLYITEDYGCRLRMVSVAGIISTIAGTGTCTSATTALQLATSASISNPRGLWITTEGTIYVTESAGNYIRKIYQIQPSAQPTSQPTVGPTNKPSLQPTIRPTHRPTTQPTDKPSRQPTAQPSSFPLLRPTAQPSDQPSTQPSERPTMKPSSKPSKRPSHRPSGQPTSRPSSQPSELPSIRPTNRPSSQPSEWPSSQPTSQPSTKPSHRPTVEPTSQPIVGPSSRPTDQSISLLPSQPSDRPSIRLSSEPSTPLSERPSLQPTNQPSTQPSERPTMKPSSKPSKRPSHRPSGQPTRRPSSQPSELPSIRPTNRPSSQPSEWPSSQPTSQPSTKPSHRPTVEPTSQPIVGPSSRPTDQSISLLPSQPSDRPSIRLSSEPSTPLSERPSLQPTNQPSTQPSERPTMKPSSKPSEKPSHRPSGQPTSRPSSQPSELPSIRPTNRPSSQPSERPSSQPTSQPSSLPSERPSTQPSPQSNERPTGEPTNSPSFQSCDGPSIRPSEKPSGQPTELPSSRPTVPPTSCPSTEPSNTRLFRPLAQPSERPTRQPTNSPLSETSARPSIRPSEKPSAQPSEFPSRRPTVLPTSSPSTEPSEPPSIRPTHRSSPQSSQSGGKLSIPPICVTSTRPSTSSTMESTNRPLSLPSSICPSYPQQPCSISPSFRPTSHLFSSSFPSYSPSPLSAVFAAANATKWKEVLCLFGVYELSEASEIFSALDNVPHSIWPGFILFGGKYLSSKNVINATLAKNSFVARFTVTYRRDSVTRSGLIVGDVNGDGSSDLFLCNPTSSICYIFFGIVEGFTNVTVGVTIIGTSSSDYFGFSVDSAGSMKNDDLTDLLVCALSKKICYVLYGRTNWPKKLLIAEMESSDGYRIIGDAADIALIGLSAAGLGDMNGDGYNDLAISVMTSLASRIYVVYVVYGNGKGGDMRLSEVGNGTNGFQIVGEAGYYTGLSISGVNDINADGLMDLAIGKLSYPGLQSTVQSTIIVFGRRTTADVMLSNNHQNKRVLEVSGGGFIVSGIGDVNQDGIPDVLLAENNDYIGKGNAYRVNYPTYITSSPTELPSSSPSLTPSSKPSMRPSTSTPSHLPLIRTIQPSLFSSVSPSVSASPSIINESYIPSIFPSLLPSHRTKSPTNFPTPGPSIMPSHLKTTLPSKMPSKRPTTSPSHFVTKVPTIRPSISPSAHPISTVPSSHPSSLPTIIFGNDPDEPILIPKGGRYVYLQGNQVFDIVGSGNIEIEGGEGGGNVYVIYPPHPVTNKTVLIISKFNIFRDTIDLRHFPSLNSPDAISFSDNP